MVRDDPDGFISMEQMGRWMDSRARRMWFSGLNGIVMLTSEWSELGSV